MLSVRICYSKFFFFSIRRRHTNCALVTGVQTCALPISRGGIGVDVAGISLLDLIISYTRVGERETDRLLGHHVPVLAVAWLGEGDHPHACNTHLGHCRTPPSRPVYKLRATISFMISLAPP